MSIPDPGGTLEDRFAIADYIGEGGYGKVFKARDLATGEIVALKKVLQFDLSFGLPQSFYRELKALSELKHENVVGYRGTVYSLSERCPYIVLEYCEYELGALIRHIGRIPVSFAKCYMEQMLCGIAEMHRLGKAHLDVKPANVFITRDNVVKLGDFGLTRDMNERQGCRMPMNVVTLAYRSPEVLLQDQSYGFPVDMWSLACVFYEMATGRMLFGNLNSMHDDGLLESIFDTCGTPSVEEWPNLVNLPKYREVIQKYGARESKLELLLRTTLPLEFAGLESLLAEMLIYDPSKRISAEDALKHPFFDDCRDPEVLPRLTIPERHIDGLAKMPRAKIPKPPKRMFRVEHVLPPPILAC